MTFYRHRLLSRRAFTPVSVSFLSSTESRVVEVRIGLFRWRVCQFVMLMILLFAVLATAASASTISYVQSNYAALSSKSTVTVKYQAAQIAGDVNVVIVGWNDTTSTVKTVSDSAGNLYSLAVGPSTTSGLLSQSIYVAKNIAPAAAGANTVTIAFSKSAYYPDIRILEYSGADPNNPVDAVGANSGSSTTSNAAAITTNATDLIVAANIVRDMTNGPGTGFTQRILTGFGDIAEDRMVSTAGSNVATAPISDASLWIMQTVALRTPGTSSAPVTPAALSCSSASMTGSGTDICTVKLNAAAAGSGLAVNLASNNSAVTVPASVTVPAGATTTTFPASVASVTSSQTATLSASANGVTQSFALQLNPARATLSVNATSIAFGDVKVNTTATQSLTLSSTGSAPVTVNSAAITGSPFSFSGVAFPLTLNPNQTATLAVEFDPTTAGAATGQLTISSNSSNNPSATIALSGTGQTSYSVAVTWNAPTSSPDPVSGYNVYKAPGGSSTYQLLTSTNSSQLSVTDTNVQDGQSYNYIIESVDSSGNESVPSNVATVTVP